MFSFEYNVLYYYTVWAQVYILERNDFISCSHFVLYCKLLGVVCADRIYITTTVTCTRVSYILSVTCVWWVVWTHLFRYMIDWTKTVVYQIHVLENQVRSSKIHLHFQFLPNSTHFINRRCVIWNFFSNLWFDFCSVEWLEMLETTELSNKMHQEWIHDCAENIRFV